VTPLLPTFFARPTLRVARDLMGCLLVHHPADGARLAGRIVETEAYTEDDPAMHGWRAVFNDEGLVMPVGRAADLFAAPGTAYVYLTYFSNWLLNVVTEPDGRAGAVLIRAIEPLEGIEDMRRRRTAVRRERDLTNGPSKLTQALGVASGEYHGTDLTRPPLFFAAPPAGAPEPRLAASSRIGLTRGVERPYRFFDADSVFVSPGVPSDIAQARRRRVDGQA
jgi:DNA-3-methyladenine glycosylase